MKRIFTKLLLDYLLIIAVIAISAYAFSYALIKDNFENNLIQRLVDINHTLEYSILPFINRKNNHELDSLIKRAGQDLKIRITIIKPDGVVLADSENDPEKMENHSDRPEVEEALKSVLGKSVRHSHTVNRDLMYVAVPIKDNGSLIAVSRMSVNYSNINELLGELQYRLFKIIGIAVLAALLLAFFFSRRITKPIGDLINVSKEVAKGNFNVKSYLKNNDELKTLSDSMNNMIVRINRLFDEMNRQKNELDNILMSMQEGLVVINKEGRIILSNKSFNDIADNREIIGKYIWEIVRDIKINKMLKKLFETGTGLSAEIQFNNASYLCSANYINIKNDIVIILNDISELMKLEKIKKDLVTNVSHELRTPLTVIKGYAEMLETELAGEKQKYMSIIRKHTNRLINIVNDLMLLSRLEETNIKPEISEIDIVPLLNDIKISFEQKIKEKNLSLKINIAPEIPLIKGDAFKIEQLLINLIDNALKYTEKGGVTINIGSTGGYLTIEVADTGIGIVQKDLERIFERFYTVDKSRSRQMDGTGLGLSIVKHITLMHKGEISVKSAIGEGTVFIVKLPVSL